MLNTLIRFAVFVVQLFKIDVKLNIAKTLLTSGVVLAAGGPSFSLLISIEDATISAQIDNIGYITLGLGVALILISTFMLIKFYNSTKGYSVLYYSPSLEFTHDDVPVYAVDKKDKYTVRDSKIGPINSYNTVEVIEDYNHLKRTFKKQMEHSDATHIYMAALGSIPYLYLLGTLLRNGNLESFIMEYINEDQKWTKLNYINCLDAHNIIMNEDANISIDDKIKKLTNSDSDEVAIALSYSYEIYKESIPQNFQESTLYLKNSLDIGLYRLNSAHTQQKLIDELHQIMHKLKRHNKTLHLFICAQASFCINFGKRYQDNVLDKLIVHNYNSETSKYNWAIEFNQGQCKPYILEE